MTPYYSTVDTSVDVFNTWKNVPAPQRGEMIRIFGDVLREHKETLSQQITTSMYKTIRESRGEVQEVIDMCDFAVGLSRQLYGLTMPSERPDHRIQELWLPLGPVGVITAFNFPVAVWGWNFCLAAICGNTVLWKPSEKAPGVAELAQSYWKIACERAGHPEYENVSIVLDSSIETGLSLCYDRRVTLISATGSVRMGREVASVVASRFGKLLLELGGNNAAIISDKCDLDLAVKGCVFSAIGTTGQRCTTLRRAFVHESVIKQFVEKMANAYATIKIGDPADPDTLIGPLIDQRAYVNMHAVLAQCAQEDERCRIYGGRREIVDGDDRYYVEPAIVVSDHFLTSSGIETFAPILYVRPYNSLEHAIAMANSSEEGLSGAIFTDSIMESEQFLRECYTGIVNINTGTSGAEIGGAFGGEKNTGGGRESGSDAWKNYMRRVTSVVNFSGKLPLAQGIVFE